MKLALTEIPLLSFRAGSAAVAGIVLLALSALFGTKLRPVAGEEKKLLLCSAITVSLWFYLSAVALTLLPAGKASLLAYTMPLWAFVTGVVFLNETITLKRCIGIAAGITAIFVLAWSDLEEAFQAATIPFGILVILGAAITWSTGSTLQKHFAFKTPISVLVGWQFTLGAIPLAFLAAAFETQSLPSGGLSNAAIAAAISVTLISQAFGLWCWSVLIKITDIAFASIAVLSVPMMSQILSFLFLGEVFGLTEAIGLSLITFGIATVLPIQSLLQRWTRRSAAR